MALKRALRPTGGRGGLIKGQVAQEPEDDLYPGFSASGQDIWLEKPQFHGDGLVLSAVGARCGKVFRATGSWGVVANTHVLLPRIGHDADYLWYLVNDEAFWERGGTAQPYVRVAETLSRRHELPPLPTQRAIADFLDRETGRIDRLVEKKRRLIELLEEKRTALISHAVTKGLDPTVPMKDSGIPWLGEIPAHWRATRLKWLLARNDGGVWGDEPRGDESDRIVVRSTEIALDGSWRLDDPAVRSLSVQDFARARLGVGDIVVVKSSGSADHVGKAAIVDPSIAEIPCAFANFVQRLRPGNDLRSDFLFYMLNARAGREQLFYWSATTTGLRNLNGSTIVDLVLPQPPIQEQMRIAEHLMKATGTIEEAEAKLARQLDKLAEYRQALITAAVTGQLDITAEQQDPEEVVA